jgi:hypothetical protein
MTNALAPTAAEDALVQIEARSGQDPLAIESMTIKKIDESEK